MDNTFHTLLRVCMIALVLTLIKGTEAAVVIVACEDEYVSPECVSGKIIRVLEANYGRTDRTTCGDENTLTSSSTNTSCISTTTLRIVKQECNGKQTCSVRATNDAFGDTCSYNLKYLNVSYDCVNDWPVLKLTDGTVEVKNMLGEVSVNANLNVYGNMNVSNGDIITGDSSLSEFRARIAKIESASETISKLQAQLDSVPRPPICMPP